MAPSGRVNNCQRCGYSPVSRVIPTHSQWEDETDGQGWQAGQGCCVRLLWDWITCLGPLPTWTQPVSYGEDGAYSHQQVTEELPLAFDKRLSFISEDKRATSVVELVKKDGVTLGLIIAGGVDKECRPKISRLRPGSIAHRSDALAVGDYILSVNDIRTSKLKHEEIVNLLKNAGDKVLLEVEYEIPASPAEACMCVCPKAIQIKLEPENGSFGFTLRGGMCSDRLKSRPLIITHVRPGGPADREGTIKAGDRLMAVDNLNLTTATLQECMAFLKQVDQEVLLTVEYDVSVMDAVRNASGPLLVEIDKTPGSQLGITLTRIHRPENAMVIESIKQASVAERCGALHVGDHVLAIDSTKVDQMTPAETMQLLKTSMGETIRLEILPVSQMILRRIPETCVKRSPMSPPLPAAPISNYNTLSSVGGHSSVSSARHLALPYPMQQTARWGQSTNLRRPGCQTTLACSSNASLESSLVGAVASCSQVCHMETAEVMISADHRGFGFTLQGATFATELLTCPPLVSSIDPGGPAERTGLLQVGDRVLSINNKSIEGLTIEEATQMILQSHPQVTLETEFDVAESVVPSSGTFTVKLAKRGASLGITITAPKNKNPGDPLIISDIKKGSVAHRTGTLQPGDRLLAIDSVRMDNCTIEDAAEILRSCNSIVKLRIRKDDTFSDEPDGTGAVVYTVELVRHGGPLGITISGTEEPFDPIIISGLTEGGLADRTGALHTGDRLLAINGKTLRGKPLSEAILLLQNSGDVVTLKISRPPEPPRETEKDKKDLDQNHPYLNSFLTPLPSVDSALESWDSSVLEASAGCARSKRASGNADSFISEKCTHQHCSSPTELQSRVSECRLGPVTDSDEDGWDAQTQSNCTFSKGRSPVPDKEDWSKVLEDLETCGQSQLLRQIERSIMGSDQDLSPHKTLFTSTLSSHYDTVYRHKGQCSEQRKDGDPNDPSDGAESTIQDQHLHCNTLPSARRMATQGSADTCISETHSSPCRGSFVPLPIEVHRVTLFKDQVYEDFGFSVSDGLYDRGVYINRIRPGGPADQTGILKPFDRILQVNETKTHDYDCCLTVPLVASAGDRIEMVISRPAYVGDVLPGTRLHHSDTFHPWVDEGDQEDCSSPVPFRQGSQVMTKTL